MTCLALASPTSGPIVGTYGHGTGSHTHEPHARSYNDLSDCMWAWVKKSSSRGPRRYSCTTHPRTCRVLAMVAIGHDSTVCSWRLLGTARLSSLGYMPARQIRRSYFPLELSCFLSKYMIFHSHTEQRQMYEWWHVFLREHAHEFVLHMGPGYRCIDDLPNPPKHWTRAEEQSVLVHPCINIMHITRPVRNRLPSNVMSVCTFKRRWPKLTWIFSITTYLLATKRSCVSFFTSDTNALRGHESWYFVD